MVQLSDRYAFICEKIQGFPNAPRPTITISQPVSSIILSASCAVLMSPFPITGIETACFTLRIISQSAGGVYISSLVLPCTAIASAPACSQIHATSTALILFLSHPLRIFTVTGTDTAFLTAETISPHKSGRFIKAQPPPLLLILGAGHPMLMSMAWGSNSIAFSAALAIISG